MSQTLQYRGYDGSVLYSAEDRMLHRCVLGVRDMISYGGTSVKNIGKNFKAAVDEYLAFCEAEGKTPDVPFKGASMCGYRRTCISGRRCMRRSMI